MIFQNNFLLKFFPLIGLILLVQMATAYNCPLFMRNQTACSCEEYADGCIVKCNGPKGPLIVEELKKSKVEVRELILSNANIIEIGPRAFNNLHIKRLVLDNNKIRVIQRNAFRGLESTLQELSIASNRLTEIPTQALEGLRVLNSLNLRCNRIGNITKQSLISVPSLIEINLGCNKICDIDGNAFSDAITSMQNIILDNNCLHSIPSKAIEGMQSLIALHLKNNHITNLGENELNNLTSLSMLTLTGNRISNISKNFTSETLSLRYIYLGENELANMEPGTLKQFVHAEIIDLSYNQLESIPVDMFNGMESLQHLNLEANSIKEIASGAFATTPLLLLWLPYNCIGSITPNMFQGTPFLKQLSLAHNKIQSIQTFSFAHLANLHTLDLSHNQISQLQSSAILGSDFLTVRIQENPFVCSQDGFHVMNGREAINLTTEPNLICKMENKSLESDACPKKPERPVRQPCCNQQQSAVRRANTSVPQQSEVSSIATSEPYVTTVSSEPTPDKNYESSSASENTETSQSEAMIETTTHTMSAVERMEKARQRARKLNMERFMRLSKRPPSNSVVMSRKEHEETLTTIMDSPDNFTHQTGTMREITDETSTPESLTENKSDRDAGGEEQGMNGTKTLDNESVNSVKKVIHTTTGLRRYNLPQTISSNENVEMRSKANNNGEDATAMSEQEILRMGQNQKEKSKSEAGAPLNEFSHDGESEQIPVTDDQEKITKHQQNENVIRKQ